MSARTEWTQADLLGQAAARFGPDPKLWAFVCPNCGDVACAQDFIDVGADPDAVGQECIGRSLVGRARGCDWAAYGVIPGPWAITLPADGDRPERVVRSFALAPADDPDLASALATLDEVPYRCEGCGKTSRLVDHAPGCPVAAAFDAARAVTARTQDEIVARLQSYAGGTVDFFGFRAEVLIDALDFDHARPFLKDGVTADEWETARAENGDLETRAKEYLNFAIGKIHGHRGISAERSVQKLAEYAWLLGRDDVLDAMARADYPQYGAPKVKAFADGMGWPWPADAPLQRMAAGEPCFDGCESGCGL